MSPSGFQDGRKPARFPDYPTPLPGRGMRSPYMSRSRAALSSGSQLHFRGPRAPLHPRSPRGLGRSPEGETWILGRGSSGQSKVGPETRSTPPPQVVGQVGAIAATSGRPGNPGWSLPEKPPSQRRGVQVWIRYPRDRPVAREHRGTKIGGPEPARAPADDRGSRPGKRVRFVYERRRHFTLNVTVATSKLASVAVNTYDPNAVPAGMVKVQLKLPAVLVIARQAVPLVHDTVTAELPA